MKIVPEVEGVTIVVSGNFNPAIFSPHWLSANGLIEQSEADAAEVQVIHPELAVFNIDWFGIAVETERMSINSRDAVSIRIFDFIIRLLGEVIPHSPARAMGINYTVHFRVKGQYVLNTLGDLLAPKDPWGVWGAHLKSSVPKGHPLKPLSKDGRIGGLRTISMEETIRPDGFNGRILARLEPSVRFMPGVFMEINDHYEITSGTTPMGSSTLLEIVGDKFDESMSRSKALVEHFIKTCEDISYAAQ